MGPTERGSAHCFWTQEQKRSSRWPRIASMAGTLEGLASSNAVHAPPKLVGSVRFPTDGAWRGSTIRAWRGGGVGWWWWWGGRHSRRTRLRHVGLPHECVGATMSSHSSLLALEQTQAMQATTPKMGVRQSKELAGDQPKKTGGRLTRWRAVV